MFSKPIAKCLISLVPYVCYVIANLRCRDFDLVCYVANQFITFIWEYQNWLPIPKCEYGSAQSNPKHIAGGENDPETNREIWFAYTGKHQAPYREASGPSLFWKYSWDLYQAWLLIVKTRFHYNTQVGTVTALRQVSRF